MSRMKEVEAQHHEKMLLGGMMADASQVVAVMRSCIQSAFFRVVKHRFIFEAIQTLHRSYSPVDVLSVTSALVDSKQLQICGGTIYLAKLVGYATEQARAHHDNAIRQGVKEAGGKVE